MKEKIVKFLYYGAWVLSVGMVVVGVAGKIVLAIWFR